MVRPRQSTPGCKSFGGTETSPIIKIEKVDGPAERGGCEGCAFGNEPAPNQELYAMDDSQLKVEYETALAEERLLWKQLEAPVADVNERVKAQAKWSAAAERARAMAQRMLERKGAVEAPLA
jgi:hypothetical protein